MAFISANFDVSISCSSIFGFKGIIFVFKGIVYPKAVVPQGSNLSPLLFLICVNDMLNPSHHQTDKSQFADDAGQWAVSKNIDLAAEYLQKDLYKLARWCAKWRIKLNPENNKSHNILQVPNYNKDRTCFIFIR